MPHCRKHQYQGEGFTYNAFAALVVRMMTSRRRATRKNAGFSQVELQSLRTLFKRYDEDRQGFQVDSTAQKNANKDRRLLNGPDHPAERSKSLEAFRPHMSGRPFMGGWWFWPRQVSGMLAILHWFLGWPCCCQGCNSFLGGHGAYYKTPCSTHPPQTRFHQLRLACVQANRLLTTPLHSHEPCSKAATPLTMGT